MLHVDGEWYGLFAFHRAHIERAEAAASALLEGDSLISSLPFCTPHDFVCDHSPELEGMRAANFVASALQVVNNNNNSKKSTPSKYALFYNYIQISRIVLSFFDLD
jgi:hypothetical protein